MKILFILLVFTLLGCKKDENNPTTSTPTPTPTNKSYSVKYKVDCPECNVIYINEFGGNSTIMKHTGVKEINLTLKSGSSALLSGFITPGISGTILTQIYVDGVLKGEATGIGDGASCTANYLLP